MLSAPEHEDLLDPRVWDQSNPVANPANSYRAAMHELLGINSPAFDMEFVLTPEEQEAVQKAVGSIAAKDANPYLGFGSTFFMEGTPVRLLDSRGGDGSLQVRHDFLLLCILSSFFLALLCSLLSSMSSFAITEASPA